MEFSLGQVQWTNQELIDSFDEFLELYSNRPFEDNTGGMKIPHMFATWFVVKKMKPKYILESGVFKGQGTWLLKQTSPESKLFCIDINPSNIIYKINDAIYLDKDITFYDWSEIDKNSTLVFLDDHQNAFERIKFLKQNNFKIAMFEDNYPLNQGDCYSLKKAFYNEEDKKVLIELLEVYYEFPPVIKLEKTRWGDEWNQESYPTPQPLFNDIQNELVLKEALDYTWINYVELKTSFEHLNNWKNSDKKLFEQQLSFNKNQLNNNYPPHWQESITFLKQIFPKNVVDLGCGVGSFYKLLKDNFEEFKYFGIDHAEAAISLAKDAWGNPNVFFVKDIFELEEEDVKGYNILYLSGIIDIIPNEQVLEKVFNLGLNYILIARYNFTEEESYYKVCQAYSMINTYLYFWNKNKFEEMARKYNYVLTLLETTALLQKY